MKVHEALPLMAGDLGMAVIGPYRHLARHGDRCAVCGPALEELRQIPDDANPLYDRCCEEGRELFARWLGAAGELREHMRERARPWGLSGLPDHEAEERAAALFTLPEAGARDIFQDEDDERREAKIQAVMVGYRRLGATIAAEPVSAEQRECANPECRTGPYGTRGRFKASPRRRFCCDACRARSRDQLTPTGPEE